MKTKYDDQEIYCRKLGHHLQFDYCRSEKGGCPCQKIFDCWFERLPVRDFLLENYSPDEVAHLSEPAPPKINTLLELIERSRKLSEQQ